MVKSQVILNRKDYMRVCNELQNLKTDLNIVRTESNKDFVDTMERRISVMQNILIEE